ncbi:MAG: YggS family pyridoxal phosphate-dependent enzyme [Streptosporangiales bacterium]
MSERDDEIRANLREVEQRLAAACDAAGRDRSELTLVAVTKTFPASDVRLLAAAGLTDIGENRDQEAAPKARECADLPLTWHFVGQLQTNKCRSVARYASVVHSVDRERLVRALGSAASQAGRVVRCLIEVRLDGDAGRGGAAPADVPALADRIAATEGVVPAGVMGIAPLGGDPARAFATLAEVAGRLRSIHPEAIAISAGMSGDLEAAVKCGATHVRIGTALLGNRPPRR